MLRFAKCVLLCFISASAMAGDIILIENHEQLEKHPNIKKALQQFQDKLLEPSLHPLIPKLQDDTRQMAELLQSEAEKLDPRPIYVVLVRSAAENMAFIRLADGTRFIE